jgi:GT2 family glycosyltransferase
MNFFEEGNFPLVSIITLNHNKAPVTAAFLESSKKLIYPHFEILVCDMASQANSLSILDPAAYPNTRFLFSKENLGYAAGNNWGICQSNGAFIFIVNNDTVLTPNVLNSLLEPFTKDDSIGVVCPKIKYFEQPEIIQYAGFRPMNPFTGRTSSIGDLEIDRGQYDVSGITHGAHGCAMMVKKDVITKTGMLPEKFFLYYEEWDWSARIKKAGFLIWYQSEATIFHKESITVGKENNIKAYYLTRNRILYMRRNSDFFHLTVFLMFFVFLSFPKAIFTYINNRQYSQLKWFLRGIGYNMVHSSKSVQ